MKASTAPGAGAGEHITQRIVPARGATLPATHAATSVFDAGSKAKAAITRQRLPMPESIEIRKGVPKPDLPHRAGAGKYLEAIRQMVPGDSVELPLPLAKSFYARAKKFAADAAPPQRFSFRKLSATQGGIWRDA